MATEFVRKQRNVHNVKKTNMSLNDIGDLLVQDDESAFIRTQSQYKPITFPMTDSPEHAETNSADVSVTDGASSTSLVHGDGAIKTNITDSQLNQKISFKGESQNIIVDDDVKITLTDKFKSAWRTALATLNLDGDQTADGVKTFLKKIKGRIENADHADNADIATKSYNSDKADSANSTEKVGHKLTISLNGNDYVFDGSSDIHISIPTTTSEPVTPSETP